MNILKLIGRDTEIFKKDISTKELQKKIASYKLENLTDHSPLLPNITAIFSEDMIILNSPDFMINPTFLIIKDLIPHQYL